MSAGADIETLPAKPPGGERLGELLGAVVRVLVPVVLALVVGGLILLVLGKNPLTYYGYVLERGLLRWGGLQETLTRMAPLLLIAAGPHRRLPGRHLESGRRRAVPAGRGHHRRARRRR